MNKIKIGIIVVVVLLGGALLAGALYTQGWDIGTYMLKYTNESEGSQGSLYRTVVSGDTIHTLEYDNTTSIVVINRNTGTVLHNRDIFERVLWYTKDNLNYILITIVLILLILKFKRNKFEIQM